VWGFAGLKFLSKFDELVEVDMSTCVRHEKDWSWFEASNLILGKHAQPNSGFVRKSIKKT
jgi:hypothetical protein